MGDVPQGEAVEEVPDSDVSVAVTPVRRHAEKRAARRQELSLWTSAGDLGKKLLRKIQGKGLEKILVNGKLDMDYWTTDELVEFIRYHLSSRVSPPQDTSAHRTLSVAEYDEAFYKRIDGWLRDENFREEELQTLFERLTGEEAVAKR